MFVWHYHDLLLEAEEGSPPALGRRGGIEVLDHDGGSLAPWRADEARSKWHLSPYGGCTRLPEIWVRGLISHPILTSVDLGDRWFRVDRLPQ